MYLAERSVWFKHPFVTSVAHVTWRKPHPLISTLRSKSTDAGAAVTQSALEPRLLEQQASPQRTQRIPLPGRRPTVGLCSDCRRALGYGTLTVLLPIHAPSAALRTRHCLTSPTRLHSLCRSRPQTSIGTEGVRLAIILILRSAVLCSGSPEPHRDGSLRDTGAFNECR